MILFREKEDDKSEELRDKQIMATSVNIDFPKGTTVAAALEQKEELRQIGNACPTKLKYAKKWRSSS